MNEEEMSLPEKIIVFGALIIGTVLLLYSIALKKYWILAIVAGFLLLAFSIWIRNISRSLDSTTLDTLYKKKNIPALIKLLRKNPLVTKEVKPLLIKLGAEATRLCILEAETANKKVKPHFLDIIAKTRNPNGMEHLINALQNNDKEICSAAIKGLGNLKRPEAINMLSKQFHSGDSDIVLNTIEALGQIGTPESEIQILKMMERNNEIKIAAVKALRNSKQEQVIHSIKTLWQQSEGQIKIEAAINLCVYPDIDTETLFDLLEVHKDHERVVTLAINTLGPRQGQKAYDLFTRLVSDKSTSIAAAAIEALGNYPLEETVSLLKKFEEHDNPQILHSIIRTLCKIKSKTAIEEVFKLFEYWGKCDPSSSYEWKKKPKNASVAAFAIKALGEINNPQVVEWLISIVGYSNYEYVKKDIERIIKNQKNTLDKKNDLKILRRIDAHFKYEADLEKSKTGAWLEEEAKKAGLPDYGTCANCKNRVSLSEAKYRLRNRRLYIAYPYYCPTCYTDRNIYMGVLKDANGEDIILEVPNEK